jgi:hypothetical protein
MQTAHRRLAVHSSSRHPLRVAVIVIAVIAIAAAYFGGAEGIEPGFGLDWITDSIFG